MNPILIFCGALLMLIGLIGGPLCGGRRKTVTKETVDVSKTISETNAAIDRTRETIREINASRDAIAAEWQRQQEWARHTNMMNAEIMAQLVEKLGGEVTLDPPIQGPAFEWTLSISPRDDGSRVLRVYRSANWKPWTFGLK
jgi:hypothetical protein